MAGTEEKCCGAGIAGTAIAISIVAIVISLIGLTRGKTIEHPDPDRNVGIRISKLENRMDTISEKWDWEYRTAYKVEWREHCDPEKTCGSSTYRKSEYFDTLVMAQAFLLTFGEGAQPNLNRIKQTRMIWPWKKSRQQ